MDVQFGKVLQNSTYFVITALDFGIQITIYADLVMSVTYMLLGHTGRPLIRID